MIGPQNSTKNKKGENDMQTIHYIKEGKERKTTRLRYSLFEEKSIYTTKEDSTGTIEYQVSKDIELLHLKNFKFANSVSIYLQNKNAVFILDHCSFSNKLVVHNGTISIDRPSYNNSTANIHLVDSEYVELNLNDNEIKNDSMTRSYEYYLTGGKELEMTGDASKTLVHVRTDEMSKITMKNLESPSMFIRHADEMRILNTNIKRGFITARGNDDYKNLYIENSTLYFPGDEINLKAEEQVEVKDTIVESPLIILPNGKTRPVRMYEVEFSSTDENASGNLLSSRLSLLSCMKTIGMRAENSCQEKKDERANEVDQEYEETVEDYERWIRYDTSQLEYYESEIASNKATLATLTAEKEEKVSHIEKSLRKQKIKKLVPANKK